MKKADYIKDLTTTVYCQHTRSDFARNTDFHIHDCCEVYYLYEGTVTIYVDGSCYVLKAGDILLMSDLEIHKILAHSGSVFSRKIVHIYPDYVRPYGTEQTDLLACFYNHPVGKNNLIHLDYSKQKEYESYFDKLSTGPSDKYGDDISYRIALVDFLISINIWQQSQDNIIDPICDERIAPIMDYIEKHLTDSFTLDDIAKDIYMDKYYMCHMFKKLTGSTIFQYIRMKRIALAKDLLVRGTTVTDTCHMAGFNDYSNFIRTFKKITGYTPNYFRIPVSKK